MGRFDEYNAAVAAGGPALRYRVDVIDAQGLLRATSDPVAAGGEVAYWAPSMGPVTLDPGRILARTASLVLPESGEGLVPDRAGDLLHPETGSRVRVKAGLVGGSLWTQATFVVDEIEATSEAGVVLLTARLVDPARPIRSELTSLFVWDEDEPVEDVVTRLLATTGVSADVTATGYLMESPGSFKAGDRVHEKVDHLLGSCGHELAVSADGLVYSRPVPPASADASDAEVWRYGPGGIPVASISRRIVSRRPQGVQVTAGGIRTAGATQTLQLWDTDPDSAGYFEGPGETQLDTVSFPYVESPARMSVAGYARLRRIGAGPKQVVIEVPPNPAMQHGDQVRLTSPETRSSALYRVQELEVPVTGLTAQRVALRAVWDPEKEYIRPADPAEGAISGWTDTFDRSDQNLEDLVTSPGSPLWTELAWSWAVVNNVAIQRHNGTWSLARYNIPLTSIDHIVYATIDEVPAGKHVGAACRSSGQFDCYAAVVSSSGRVSLQMWQGGKLVQELGSYSTGTDPAGKTVAVKAVGETISALWEGSTVVSVTDGRRRGLYTGMLGLGGSQGSTAPGVRSASGQVAG